MRKVASEQANHAEEEDEEEDSMMELRRVEWDARKHHDRLEKLKTDRAGMFQAAQKNKQRVAKFVKERGINFKIPIQNEHESVEESMGNMREMAAPLLPRMPSIRRPISSTTESTFRSASPAKMSKSDSFKPVERIVLPVKNMETVTGGASHLFMGDNMAQQARHVGLWQQMGLVPVTTGEIESETPTPASTTLPTSRSAKLSQKETSEDVAVLKVIEDLEKLGEEEYVAFWNDSENLSKITPSWFQREKRVQESKSKGARKMMSSSMPMERADSTTLVYDRPASGERTDTQDRNMSAKRVGETRVISASRSQIEISHSPASGVPGVVNESPDPHVPKHWEPLHMFAAAETGKTIYGLTDPPPLRLQSVVESSSVRIRVPNVAPGTKFWRVPQH